MVDFRSEKRSNATHASTADPDERLYKKSPGTGAMLCFIGHALMENRSGLIVQGDLTQADGHAERRAALDMVHRHSPGSTRRLTLGADTRGGGSKHPHHGTKRRGFPSPHPGARIERRSCSLCSAGSWTCAHIQGPASRLAPFVLQNGDRELLDRWFLLQCIRKAFAVEASIMGGSQQHVTPEPAASILDQ